MVWLDMELGAVSASNHIITKGTVDEKVMKALQNKDAGQELLLEAVKAIIGGTDL